ncbi:DUF2306 domain-containing protein [bacterium]|nr:DUF2306 domain-containing protein [bacterium]
MRKLGWLCMTLLGLVVGYGSLVYVLGDPAHYDAVFRPKYTYYHTMVVTHGLTSVLALLIGPWQFLLLRPEKPTPRSQASSPVGRNLWHRRAGWLYFLCLILGALTGMPMALMAEGGVSARLAFLTVDVLWLVTAWLSLKTARQRKFAAHRRWMVRSYALTFGAVVLRLYLYQLQRMGYEFNAIYPFTPWLSWLTSLAVAEWILAEV